MISRTEMHGLVCAFIVAVGGFGLSGCSSSPEQQAIATLRQLGGKVKLDDQSHAVEVDLSHTAAMDDDLDCLKELSHLQGLNLGYTHITGRGLEPVAGLSQLRTLFLVGSQVDDAGFSHLKSSSLQTLHLGRTKITSAGLAVLAQLPALRTLVLRNTEITDAGLVHLKGRDNLGTVVLSNTKTTHEGVQRLRQSLPKTRIDR